MKKLLYIMLLNLCVFNAAFAGGGNKVAAGGLYTSYQHSIDGSDVTCGGQYTSYKHSIDGSSVSAGGLFTSYKHSY